jgi:hypothetical protein
MTDAADLPLAGDRVELVWPGKQDAVRVRQQEDDGRWYVSYDDHAVSLKGLANVDFFPENTGRPVSLVVQGQRHDALTVLRRAVGPAFRLIYLDLPRLRVDDATTAFETVSPLRLTTWLAMTRAFLLEARELLTRQGVVAVHCGEEEAHYAKIILDELFRDKRVGTIVWQKTYSPQNMGGMKEFTDAHDIIYVYARDKEALPPVGLRRPPEGYTNTDGDPRGAWKAEHKGAKTFRENSNFDTFQPPYRWRLVGGALPPGLWRVSPFTGVIWGEPQALGTYEFSIEVADREGATAVASFSIEIKEAAPPPPRPEIPWIREPLAEGGALAIETKNLPAGVLGQKYSAVVLARGGIPFLGKPIRPGSGRYWDFAWATLLEAYRDDAVYLGSREPTSIPTPKKYAPPAGTLEVDNQQSIWLGRAEDSPKKVEALAGFTQDATKHLKAMKQLKLLELELPTAKPEILMLRLLQIFTDEGDLVLEPMSNSADMAATALKAGRRCVALQGPTTRDRQVTAMCALPRLRAVVAGEDNDLEARSGQKGLSVTYVPFAGGGSFATAELGPDIAVIPTDDDRAVLTSAARSMSPSELSTAVLTAAGYLPPPPGSRFAPAISGRGRAILVGPGQALTTRLLAEVASEIERHGGADPTVVFYFRAVDEVDEREFAGLLSLRRVPFDLLQRGVS